MDVSEARAKREIDAANRRIRDQEQAHAREIENLNQAQQSQIKSLEKNQKENLEETTKQANERVMGARDYYESSIDNFRERYDRALEEERNSNYDKFGKLTAQSSAERNADRELYARQIQDLQNAHVRDGERERYLKETESNRQAKDYQNAKVDLQRGFDKKLDSLNEHNRKQREESAAETRRKIDDNIRSNTERLAKEKLGDDLKYHKLAEDSKADLDSVKRNYGLREQQLANEKNIALNAEGRAGQKVFEDYKDRMNQTVRSMTEDNQFNNANKDRINANRIAEAEINHQRRMQDMQSQFRQNENALRYQLLAEKDRNNIKENVNDKRLKQENYLALETAREHDRMRRDELKQNYSEQLGLLREDAEKRVQGLGSDMRKQLNENDWKASKEREYYQGQKVREVSDKEIKFDKEKKGLIKAFAERHESLENLRKRQLEDQSSNFYKQMRTIREQAQRDVSDAAKENQIKLYTLGQNFSSRTNELENLRRSEGLVAQDTMRERLKRVTENYGEAVMAQKENFDEATNSLKLEGSMRLAQARAQTDFDHKNQMSDLQTKNRLMSISYESKINQLEDDHKREVLKAKIENEKNMRETLRRAKEAIDVERARSQRELEDKERQMKDRLRIQEESFKEYIDKVKKTNELALKKS